jgi:dynein heavy chain
MDKFEPVFNYTVDCLVEFVRLNCNTATRGNGSFCSSHVIRLIGCYIDQFRPKETEEDEEVEHVLPKDIDDKLYNALLYSLIWGIGGIVDENGRIKFDEFLNKLIAGEEVIEAYNLDLGQDDNNERKVYEPMKLNNKLGEYNSFFEIYFDIEDMKWTNWMNTIDKYVVNKEDTFLMLSIPTVDTVRLMNLCTTLLKNKKHALLVGPTGTGKSVSILKMLKREFDN